MIAVAPHHWFVQPDLAPYITFGVGYCFIPFQRQMRRPNLRDKANIVPTPYFFIHINRRLLGIGLHK